MGQIPVGSNPGTVDQVECVKHQPMDYHNLAMHKCSIKQFFCDIAIFAKYFGGHAVFRNPHYRKIPVISPGLIQLRKGFWVGL